MKFNVFSEQRAYKGNSWSKIEKYKNYKKVWRWPCIAHLITRQVLSQLAFWLKRKFNIDFQDGSHLGFPIRMILATFDLQITLILPMKFQVNWPFGSG